MVAPFPLSDAHCHLFDLLPHQDQALDWLVDHRISCVSSCHHRAEWQGHVDWLAARPALAGLVRISFGIHPQNPVWEEREFMEDLIRQPPNSLPRLAAIGECGFDFFGGKLTDGPHGLGMQAEIFEFQLGLAKAAGLPLVVHLRRATDMVFTYARPLSALPAVIFHAWPSPPEEAFSLLKRGINAYFSLGTPLLQGKKSALRSLAELPIDRILLESDAPYQVLKGQDFTDFSDLATVYNFAANFLGIEITELQRQINLNFRTAYAWAGAI